MTQRRICLENRLRQIKPNRDMRAIATLLAERGDPLHDRCRYSESAAHCFSSIGMVGGEQFVRVDDLCTAISRCYPQLAGGGFFEYGSIMEYGRFQPGQDRLSLVIETSPAGMAIEGSSHGLSARDIDRVNRMNGVTP